LTSSALMILSGAFVGVSHVSAEPGGHDWVDAVLLHGPDREMCLGLDAPLDRGGLRRAVRERQERLAAAGVRAGGCVALRLPPSLAYIANLLAAWRIGAQVVLLDHRLTRYEVDRALDRLVPQVVVEPASGVGGPLSGRHDIVEKVTPHAGRPAATWHALVQLSSGSTGPSKVIGRTAAELVAEIERYTRIEGMPRRGDRVVVLNSLVHTFGLIGGLLHGLHARVPVVLPHQITATGIFTAIGAAPEPTTVLGVPFHIELLATVADPPPLPQLVRAISGGELLRPELPERFTTRYAAPLGECYGMTEAGVVAMDAAGRHRPAVGPPAPGISLRVADGELLIARPTSPYLGPADPTRWVDGWLRSRDAAEIDPATGVVRILGRLDSQVAVGGLKVDLNEVEHSLAGVPGVTEVVVVYDNAITAYLALEPTATIRDVTRVMRTRLAPFKRPQTLHVVPRLPRTASGKRVRDRIALRAAARQVPAEVLR
jgi:3-hydroxy-4-methylanthranilate adenylyltransferase